MAADVLLYFGELTPVLSAAAQSLRPGGLFAFTVERHDGEAPYVLNATRRFAHSIGYVRSALTEAELHEVSARAEVVRTEAQMDVAAWVVVARR